MGLRRYRSVEDMPASPPRRPLDPENLVIAFGLMDLAHRIAGLSFPPGIKKYRSHDEMLRARTAGASCVIATRSTALTFGDAFAAWASRRSCRHHGAHGKIRTWSG